MSLPTFRHMLTRICVIAAIVLKTGCANPKEIPLSWNDLEVPGMRLELKTEEDIQEVFYFHHKGVVAAIMGTKQYCTFPVLAWRLVGNEIIIAGENRIRLRLEVVSRRGKILTVRRQGRGNWTYIMSRH